MKNIETEKERHLMKDIWPLGTGIINLSATFFKTNGMHNF